VPARRSAEQMEKDQRAYDLFRRGLSYRQISAEMGYRTPSAAYSAVRRAARDNAADPLDAEEQRQAFYDRYQDYRRAAQRVLATRHYVTTQSGKLVDGPDGEFLVDDAPVLQALDRLVKVDDQELRLRGLYPPARARIEVVDDEVARALVDQMEAEIAALSADPGRDFT
jgi:hypothetical protein